ncbi:MAG: hypothetical protein H0W70_01165 [Actinobacteria bacterium]|nr:hypothetical protein [Actinomycetota bacterium]
MNPALSRAAASCLLLALPLVACDRRPSPTIGDKAFVARANALCGRQLPALRAERRQSDVMGNTPKNDRGVTAAKIEKVADGLDHVADQLGNLPVRRQDQGGVAAWLEEWANFTGIGRRYAAAVRTERAAVYSSIAATGNGPVRRIARFARANRMDNCVL